MSFPAGEASTTSPVQPALPLAAAADQAAACCALYGNPLVELLVGDSLHPGGLGLTRALLAPANLPPGSHLLDVGCGTGASAALAADAFGLFVDGIDVNSSTIDRARSRVASPSVRLLIGRMEALPFADGEYDGALAECVLSTVADRAAVLGEIHRVLRTGAPLLLSDVVAEPGIETSLGLPAIVSRALCVTGAWRRGEARSLLGEAGFVVERERDERRALETLLDRIETRIGLLRTIGRDLGDPYRAIVGALGIDQAQFEGWPEILASVRAAISGGRIGYVSLIARRRD